MEWLIWSDDFEQNQPRLASMEQLIIEVVMTNNMDWRYGSSSFCERMKSEMMADDDVSGVCKLPMMVIGRETVGETYVGLSSGILVKCTAIALWGGLWEKAIKYTTGKKVICEK